jgi:hypothetical protein
MPLTEYISAPPESANEIARVSSTVARAEAGRPQPELEKMPVPRW